MNLFDAPPQSAPPAGAMHFWRLTASYPPQPPRQEWRRSAFQKNLQDAAACGNYLPSDDKPLDGIVAEDAARPHGRAD